MSPTGQSYGKALPDQVDRIADLFDSHLVAISDVRELYRERVALERDYATKLQMLARKASEKKSKTTASLILGDEPTKVWDESVLRRSTLDNAYAQIIASMTLSAQDHFNLADAVTLQVIDVIKLIEKKSEDTKKKQIQFYQKLLSDRDRIYSERIKSKQKYDEECLEVETYRQKQGHAGDRHADRAAKQYEQQQIDMFNGKNTYLISTSIANATKDKFYSEDLPNLEDSFRAPHLHVALIFLTNCRGTPEELQTRLVIRFSKVLLHAQELQITHQDTIKGRVASAEKALAEIDPTKDQDLFIDHNIRPFVAPGDWVFEPCSSHYDTGEMSVESEPKVFIQNKLGRCRTKLQELVPLIKTKQQEVEKYAKLVAAYTSDKSLGNIDEISDNYLEAKQQLTFFLSSERILNAEMDVIVAALGDDEGSQRPHTFKSSSFSIPTQCGYCKSSIWGLSKQGKTCKGCGLSVHSKCELKVPAECSGVSAGRQKSTVSVTRSSTKSSGTSSGASSVVTTPTASSFVRPDAATHVQDSYPSARVVFDFTPTSPFELAVSEGITVHVLEDDDGSGWVKVADDQGAKGLVPASYVEFIDETDAPPSIPVNSRPIQGAGKYVRGVYDYQAQGSDELGIKEGERIQLSSGPNGGQNYADGWWEGINAKGKKGIFPSNYVEMV